MFTNLKKVVASILLVSMVITSNGFSSFAATMVTVMTKSEESEGEENKNSSSLFVAKTKEAGSNDNRIHSICRKCILCRRGGQI